MRFPERHLQPYAQPVAPNELKADHVYFSVTFVDDDTLVPVIETLVFVGRDLAADDSEMLYFQDVFSYRAGVRFDSERKDKVTASFFSCAEGDAGNIFGFENALEMLMLCSLRRAKAGLED